MQIPQKNSAQYECKAHILGHWTKTISPAKDGVHPKYKSKQYIKLQEEGLLTGNWKITVKPIVKPKIIT